MNALIPTFTYSSSDVIPDAATGTVRPALPPGDQFFGLEPGTNGTAAAARREAYGPEGFTWLRHDGSPATGLQRIPTGNSHLICANPWSGT